MLLTPGSSLLLLSCLALGAPQSAAPENRSGMYPTLQAYIEQRVGELERISAQRQARLRPIVQYVRERRAANQPARLVFICTHNSRRSHLAQIWAQTAAAHYRVAGVQTYSGGTEATAFNPRAVAAVERAGFRTEKGGHDENPVYFVRFADDARPMACFSKPYDHAPNPRQDFCAVLVCSDADEKCPVVDGATTRAALPYEDPKAFDGRPEESAKYDERSRDIAREMLWVFAQAAATE
jgi:hypothetical protein